MSVSRSPMVYIVLGVFNPNLNLLERQLRSLLDQTHQSLEILLIGDGPLPPEAETLIGSLEDQRFVTIDAAETVGVHANYARGLNAALERSQSEDDLFAFCDQDDYWHQEKLARQVAMLASQPESGLVHCDARVVDEEETLIAPSLFAFEQRSKRFGLLDLLVMNSITGMTCLIRKSVAQAASGFPMAQTREILHDHWLALVAASQGRVTFIDEALVDYLQHGANTLGARDQTGARVPGQNLLFGGRAYWQRCARQYAWRVESFEALSASQGGAEALNAAADIRGGAGAIRLLIHMLSSWLRGEARQAAQSWRLLAGKMLS